MTRTCRRCSECQDEDHHLIEDFAEGSELRFVCKHCDATISIEDAEAVLDGERTYCAAMWSYPVDMTEPGGAP